MPSAMRADVRSIVGRFQGDLDERLRDAVSGSVVMVTGASSGIGAATARSLGSAGATVLLVARSEDGLHAVEREITASGGSARVLPTDLCDPGATQALIETVQRDHGAVDVLAVACLREGTSLDLDELREFLTDRLADYKQPRQLVISTAPLPRTALEKVDKAALRSTLGLETAPPR